MTRKMFTAAVAVVALVFGVFAMGSADVSAQSCSYDLTYGSTSGVCATPVAGPGAITNAPAAPTVGLGFGLNPIAAAADGGSGASAGGGSGSAGGGAGGGSALAVTGSEAQVLGYVGTGLIAFGAVALGSRRKFFQGTLD